jgi:recombination protein RecT
MSEIQIKQTQAISREEQWEVDLVRLKNQIMQTIAGSIRNFFQTEEEMKAYLSVVTTALRKTPELLYLDRLSILSAIQQCAQDGLYPDGKQAAFVKYGNRIQYLPMFMGILKKVRESGTLITITAKIVYERDKFKYWINQDGESFTHEPHLIESEKGKPLFTYAQAIFRNGERYFEIISEKDMMNIKGMSKARGGPWDGVFADEMRRKSVLKRLAKRLPMEPNIEAALDRDNEMYDLNKAQPVINTKTEEPVRGEEIVEEGTFADYKPDPLPI